ncbi:tRNA (adenosine(37)-N6)-threonylcarbamoyltransferase complex ATPase subunit type 1 TsaE [Alicyclobacillus tolerans]|uniref:tRNA (adenosine(37)-N6)-threonylcarbamoyltransferase complex ATPase subunit type 1 TsaE n=1 Tax=Alicyclobacillus tolerans TaxID=90970 RepID=UPI001F007EB8|nr:tRNA (adenosine(37)-N6)-threonylcarbamoyltransferase complex ATPase subunit type 1 TsaE [Alicyclobacillus tolerans]MCF8566358.1 tRNA (adenosine(37)-N6)-threonylcarbamoyltransferase complex ATPase subunit type 1 TsaE [Alicyclobacillus tolerans]
MDEFQVMDELQTIETHAADQTRRLGRALGQLLQAGDVVFLSGALGAGKTTLSQGVAAGAGIEGPVTSPTFTLIHEYEGRIPLVHMDLYRLLRTEQVLSEPVQFQQGQPEQVQSELDGTGADAQLNAAQLPEHEATALGLDDYFESGAALLIEWPGGLEDYVEDALYIRVDFPKGREADERVLTCRAKGPRSRLLLSEWVKQWRL